MKVLVTGSEGLIGRPLCRLLEEQGHEVDHYDITQERNVLEYGAVLKYVGRADAVIHLAAQSGVEQARARPHYSWTLNFIGTLNVLNACKEHDKPVVIASSNHVYGHGDAPVTEDGPMLQLDTYSATKHAIDIMAQSYIHNYGIQAAIIRNTNCFGPDDPHEDHIVPSTILSLLQGDAPVIRSAGKTVKSYLYVDDVASAYAAALDAVTSYTAGCGVFNVSGDRISVTDLVSKITKLVGKDIDPIILGEANDQSDEWLDDSKFRQLTGWKPTYTLDAAIIRTFEGFSKRMQVTA